LIAQLIRSAEYQEKKSYILPLILGEDTIGNSVIVDLTKMPHLLVAGSTGSGKSVALNTMLVSLLCKSTPEELRLILIDPKRLEFAPYADIAHLLFPIITDPKNAIKALKWAVSHMEERYQKMAEAGARTIVDYNLLCKDKPQEQFPYLVIMIDELADLMMTAGKEIEDLITRLAQMARAAGIHLLVATQRPSVDVITGLIKVNFPSRISFRVTSKTDSRTILDAAGADKLLGRGDMLFLSAHEGHLKRVHGAYVSDEEIFNVVSHIQKQREVCYLDLSTAAPDASQAPDDVDEQLMQDILQFLSEIDEVSISLLQRKFRIGYNRSARIIDALEGRGFVGPSTGSKTRKVIRQ
jgi:S-DNA-T family DNA segregation ATPase FtsK/SpoIIIE